MYICILCKAECNIEPKPRAEICAACAKTAFLRIQGQYAMLPAKIVAAVQDAESCHGVSLFYTNEVTTEHKKQIGNRAAMDGFCPGFTANWKQFKLAPSTKPSQALANFMGSTPVVVAECEAFVQAVVFTAFRELFACDDLFDAVFYDLQLGVMSYVDKFVEKTVGRDEGSVVLGDWVYVARTKGQSMEDFQDYAQKTGTGGAASAWNLICTSAASPKQYVGFGLSPTAGEVVQNSLHQIMEILAEGIPRRSKNISLEMDFYVDFIRRVDTAALDNRMKACFPPFT